MRPSSSGIGGVIRTSFRTSAGSGDKLAAQTSTGSPPATFRTVVATIIAEEADVDRAGRQLGHAADSNVTELHYIDRPSLAPNSSPILDRLVG